MKKNSDKKIEKISEKLLEKKLAEGVKKLGGKALKFSSITDTSYPDRLVMLTRGQVFWVELKSTGCKQTKLQELRSRELRDLGFEVFVVDDFTGLNSALEHFRNCLDPMFQ